jgi:hypothetical protein
VNPSLYLVKVILVWVHKPQQGTTLKRWGFEIIFWGYKNCRVSFLIGSLHKNKPLDTLNIAAEMTKLI